MVLFYAICFFRLERWLLFISCITSFVQTTGVIDAIYYPRIIIIAILVIIKNIGLINGKILSLKGEVEMWSKIILYLPGWEVLLQGLIIFIIPYILSKFFDLICGSDKDELG